MSKQNVLIGCSLVPFQLTSTHVLALTETTTPSLQDFSSLSERTEAFLDHVFVFRLQRFGPLPSQANMTKRTKKVGVTCVLYPAPPPVV